MSTILSGTELGYRKNIVLYFGSCFIHLILGIVLGKHIDQLCEQIAGRLRLPLIVYVFMQMVVMVTVLYLIEKHVSFYFADEWQRTTPGVLFSFSFFVSQKRLTSNLESLL